MLLFFLFACPNFRIFCFLIISQISNAFVTFYNFILVLIICQHWQFNFFFYFFVFVLCQPWISKFNYSNLIAWLGWVCLTPFSSWRLTRCTTCLAVLPPVQHSTKASAAPEPGLLRSPTANAIPVPIGDRRPTTRTKVKCGATATTSICSSRLAPSTGTLMVCSRVPGDRCLGFHFSSLETLLVII